MLAGKSNPSQNSDEGLSIRTDESIGAAAGVSRDTVRKVEKILETASPSELVGGFRRGCNLISLRILICASSALRLFLPVIPAPKQNGETISVETCGHLARHHQANTLCHDLLRNCTETVKK